MIKAFIISLVDIKAIYHLKEMKWRHAILHFLYITLILVLPLQIALIQMDSVPFSTFQMPMTTENVEGLLSELPNCAIASQRLTCPELPENPILLEVNNQRLWLVFDGNDDTDTIGDNRIYLQEYGFRAIINTIHFDLTYSGFERNVYFSELQALESTEAMKVLINGFVLSAKPVYLLPVLVVVFLVFLGMNLIFLVIVSLLARLLKYRDSYLPPFNEILKISIYASTIPSIIGFVLGLFNAYPLVPVIYNFSVPAVMFIVYIKSKDIDHGTSMKTSKDVKYLE